MCTTGALYEGFASGFCRVGGYRVLVIDEETIERSARELARAAGEDAQVILFGSHARGEGNPHSDLDFLVIEPTVEDRRAEAVRLRRALRGILAPIDVLVFSREQAEEWRGVHGTVIHAALAEGRVLHGRATP